ncbi:phage capsid protein [Spirosoma aerolatum]|uniref:phage capsid protein n=1 Tax=Spirosoma aerolatum TaxID=1211326 RepID=UPI0009AC9232|nr:phage capsid protein [Spirosoma aerolatum]
MALQPEIWHGDIVGNFYASNEFMLFSTNADQYVVGGRAVHIPNANAPSNVSVNRSVLPATVSTRTDIDVNYTLDEYTSDPISIPNIDTIQLSYDKRASVMAEDTSNIKDKAAKNMLYKWAVNCTTNVFTTGTAASATAAGATGTRKLFTKADLLSAKTLMDKQDVPQAGRVAVLPPDFLAQLLADKDLAVNFTTYADIAKGVVGEVYGFKIMMRSSTLAADKTTNVAKAPSAATAATDNSVALCWHPVAVERAMGTVKMFGQQDNPLYYADIYSFLLMMGGRARRNDGKGIVQIIETWVS